MVSFAREVQNAQIQVDLDLYYKAVPEKIRKIFIVVRASDLELLKQNYQTHSFNDLNYFHRPEIYENAPNFECFLHHIPDLTHLSYVAV